MAIRVRSIIGAAVAVILLGVLVVAMYGSMRHVPHDVSSSTSAASADANGDSVRPSAATDANASVPGRDAGDGGGEGASATGSQANEASEGLEGGGSGLRALFEGVQLAVAEDRAARQPAHPDNARESSRPGDAESTVEMDVSGWVVDSDGKPLAAIEVLMVGGGGARSTTSAEDGSFVLQGTLAMHELSSLPAAVTLVALGDSQGYRTEQKRHVPVDAKDVEFVMTALAQVEGIAVDAVTGQPLTYFEARIGIIWEGEQYEVYPLHVGWEHFSNPDGAFRLTNYGPRKLALQARAPGYILSETEFLVVPPGEGLRGVVIRVERGGDITGVVIDAVTGRPVESARVGCVEGRIWGDPPDIYGQETLTGPDGRFVLPGEEGGPVTHVMALHPNYSPGFASNIDPSKRRNVVIELRKGGALFGTVTNGGSPVPEMGVMPKMTLAYPVPTYGNGTGTDGRGAYRLDRLPPGIYVVRFIGRDGTTYGKALARIASGMDTRLDADLQAFFILGGWVKGVESYDDIEFFLSDVQLPEEIMYNAGVEEDGHFEFGRVLPGDYLVNVVKNDPPRKRYTTVVSFQAGEQPEIMVDFSAIPPE